MISGKFRRAINGCLPWMLALAPLLKVINPHSGVLTMLSAGLMVISAILLLGAEIIGKARVKISFGVVLLLLVCLLSIVSNYIYPEYQPWKRLAFFVIFLCCYGPLFTSRLLSSVKYKTLDLLCKGFVAISFFAITAYTLKLLITGEAKAFWPFNPGDVMVIAGVNAVALLYIFHKLFDAPCRKKSLRILYSVLLAILSVMLILASSRSALIGVSFAMVVSCVAAVIFGKKKILSYKNLVAPVIIIIFTTSAFVPITGIMQSKMNYVEQKGTYLASRSNRWENRVREIKESPVIGVGFSSYRYCNTALNPFDDVSTVGRVEPGSGWLFVLSSIGVVGFAVLISIYIRRIDKNLKCYTTYSLFLLSLLAFFAVHLSAEGYILSAGSPLCAAFWLSLMKRENAVS